MPGDGAPGSAPASAVLTVDLAALRANWTSLRDLAAAAECGACVKGDGYGLGLERCAPALWEAGCCTFFVATHEDGQKLRRRLPRAVIYVLNGLMPGLASLYAAHDLRPALASLEEIAEWAAARPAGKAALHVDTGINRLGLAAGDVEALAGDPARLAGVDVALVMSHLAYADEPERPGNEVQRRLFDALRARLPSAPASLANSPGIFLGSSFHYDLVRPGVALYGGNPIAGRANPMRPVVHLEAAILQVRAVERGASVGYGGVWTAGRDSRIGVIGVGYRDGLLRSLAARPGDAPAHVLVGGVRAPIVGRVSMDLITVDLTDVPPVAARRGGRAELIGAHITVDDVARAAGTIAYEILTGLGSRFARVYIG